MDRDQAVNEIVQRMKYIAQQSKHAQQGWQTKGESAALLMLQMRGGSALPGEIAQAVDVSTARIAALLKQMEGKGLIRREVDEQDRRRVQVLLTEEGSSRAQNLMDCLLAKWGRLVDALGEEDTEHLIRILEKIGTFAESEVCEYGSDERKEDMECQN